MRLRNLSRSQLDRLGDRLKGGAISLDDLRLLAEFRNAFIADTNSVAKALSHDLGHIKAVVTQRPAKSTPSIVAKLQRESIRLTQMQDIGGVRVVVSKISVQDRVVAVLGRRYPSARIVDRRRRPHFGYRAVHVIVEVGRHWIEVQIRTSLQNAWAQLSEKLADIHGHGLKYGAGAPKILKDLQYLTRYCKSVEDREVQLNAYKRAEINTLNRKRRSGRMTRAERARLEEYRQLLREQRQARAAMLKYVKERISS
jgi:putative GTP pyrophosphokinase